MKKNLFRVFATNLIKMVVTFITAFIVPMVLSVDSYGYLKMYQFYVSYIGITHLGFCDGVYLEYGGKDEKSINKKRISKQGSSLFVFEFFISLIAILFGVVRRDIIIICFGITMLPNVLYTFYNYVFQAIGDFRKYTQVMNIYSIVNLFINLMLVLLRVRDYRIYMVLYVFIETVPFIVGAILFKKNDWLHFEGFDKSIFKEAVKLGILLMIGNFAYGIFIGIDKWFIKFTMKISYFSFYSFASQLITVVNMFITPIAMTLYSNMSKKREKAFEIAVKKLIVVILMIIPIVIYAMSFIIEHFMKQYIPAITVVSTLLISQIFLALNTSIFVNLYKVYRKQKEYFVKLLISLGIAALLDLLIAFYNPNIFYYAFATMASCIVWLVLNINSFKYMKPQKEEAIYVTLLLIVYISTLFIPNMFIRGLIYIVIYIGLTKYLMKNEWDYLLLQKDILVNKIKTLV